MDDVMLALKYVLFYGMQAVVLAIMAVVLIAGLFQFFRSRVRAIQKGPFRHHKSPLPFVSTEDWEN